MIKNNMETQIEQTAKAFINSGLNFRIFIRDLQTQIAHEAMIKTDGNMTKAVELLGGIQRETMSNYLGMRSEAWNRKYRPEKF